MVSAEVAKTVVRDRAHMVVLGLDPGLASTGFGAIRCNGSSTALLRCGYIKTLPREPIAERLHQIHADVTGLMEQLQPDLVAMENVFSLVRYPKAGILLGAVMGVLHLAVFHDKKAMLEITPKEVKNALVGYGSANKEQVRMAVERSLNIRDVSSFHAADALAVALTAFYRKGMGRQD